MPNELSFETRTHGTMRMKPDVLAFAAFASRDPADAEHHRAELAERGIVVPDHIPCFYTGVPETLSQADRIETGGRRLLPEVEFVVIESRSGRFVTLGCDLFDEEIEKTDLERSKAVCATPIASKAFAWDGLEASWDSFRIWMRCDGRLLQQGHVGKLMLPGRLVELGHAQAKPSQEAFIYSGTLPLLETFGRHLSEIEIGLEGPLPGQQILHRFRLASG